jgi:hypothetical protein
MPYKWLCKIIYVIANEMKCSVRGASPTGEAIARVWDCFIPLRSTRNDKYIFNFAQLLIHHQEFDSTDVLKRL